MNALLIGLPAAAGAAMWLMPSGRARRALLQAAAAGHFLLTLLSLRGAGTAPAGWWLGLDGLGAPFLFLISALFLAAAPAAARTGGGGGADDPAADRLYFACLLWFLSTMTLVALSRNLGLLWVAVEATTLASAPLVYRHRGVRALEATWKYLLICSVGIALALLGNFLLAVACHGVEFSGPRLQLDELVAHAALLNPPWLRAAFILMLVGYGVKMGLAPLHNWLPDAHSEAPSPVSALLSGALLNCAFLAILRIYTVVSAAGQGAEARALLCVLGLVSMAVAAVFILGQADFKRLLAYSSVEHMGILALGVGLGGTAALGVLLHLLNHAFVKAMLFLVAGNLLAAYGSTRAAAVRGAGAARPVSAALWLAGILAIAGSPPFGTFVSELLVLQGAVAAGRYGVAALYVALLTAIFIGMMSVALPMVQGAPPADLAPAGRREAWWTVVPPAALLAGAVLLGLWVPPPVLRHLERTALLLGGG